MTGLKMCSQAVHRPFFVMLRYVQYYDMLKHFCILYLLRIKEAGEKSGKNITAGGMHYFKPFTLFHCHLSIKSTFLCVLLSCERYIRWLDVRSLNEIFVRT